MSLSLPSSSATAAHVPFPSANAALSLQELYNLTLRHWEPSIFSGLLASYTSLNPTAASRHPYGAATPTREPDMSQWMNVSPGADLSGLLGGTGTTPRESLSHNMDFRFEPEARRSSTVRMDGDEQAKGIDEILAAMEEGKEAQERAIAQAVEEKHPKDTKKRKSRSEEFQLPTPETDSSDSPSTRRPSESRKGTHSPEDMASPFVTASSATASTVSKIVPAVTRQPHPTSLMMPDATFVPPPPMCMFFNPAFKDLTQGKVGIWKGDLEVRGRGGGKFSILIVGEETTGHLW
jgi:hypothetical protein